MRIMNSLGRFFYYGFIATVFLFLYLPIIILVLFSFNEGSFSVGWQGFTFDWYAELFSSLEIWGAFRNSFFIACSSAFFSVTLSTALVLAYGDYLKERHLTLFYANIAIPEIVLAIGLLTFFYFFSITMGLLTLIVSHTVIGLGYSVPLIYASYNSIDKKFLEVSRDLGATGSQTIRFVILPLLAPAIGAAAILVFVLSFDDFVLSFFCSGGSTQTLPMYIFSLIRSGASPVLNALSAVLLIGSSLLVLLFAYLRVRREDNVL